MDSRSLRETAPRDPDQDMPGAGGARGVAGALGGRRRQRRPPGPAAGRPPDRRRDRVNGTLTRLPPDRWNIDPVRIRLNAGLPIRMMPMGPEVRVIGEKAHPRHIVTAGRIDTGRGGPMERTRRARSPRARHGSRIALTPMRVSN